MVFCAYGAFPLLDLPLIKLSLSAPIFYLIVIEVFFHSGLRFRRGMGFWLAFALFLGSGIAVSFLINGFKTEGKMFDALSVIMMTRYSYWLLVFFMTVYLLLRKPELGGKIVRILCVMIAVLALLRWYEALVYGKIGAWTNPVFMTQNSYGVLFSSYAPLFLVLIFENKKYRLWFILLYLITLGAVFINGSRSSWVTNMAAIFLFVFLYAFSSRHKIQSLIRILLITFCLGLAGLTFWRVSPENFKTTFQQRFSTFEDLDKDKSYQIRKVMQQKGLILFRKFPLEGCGLGRFTKTFVVLDLPPVLWHHSQESIATKSPHNSYLHFLAEAGLAGSVPFILFLIFLTLYGVIASIQLVKYREFWPLGVYVSFISMSIHFWTIAGLGNTGSWIKYGMVAAIISLADARKREKKITGKRAFIPAKA